jgi:hypothetical protein
MTGLTIVLRETFITRAGNGKRQIFKLIFKDKRSFYDSKCQITSGN